MRGERLHLVWSRWSNESGFETCYLIVHEVNERGQVIYEGRFDEDDFEDAYRELDPALLRRRRRGVRRRRCRCGRVSDRHSTDAISTACSNDLVDPDMRVENRTRSGFPDRSADELRASHEELNRMVASTQSWHSAERWLSPNVASAATSGDADGQDGERYEWTRLIVGEVARWTVHGHVRVRTRGRGRRRSPTPRSGCVMVEQS